MGYNFKSKYELLMKINIKVDLKVIKSNILLWIWQPKVCTHRPSLSPKGEISRNIAGVMEIVPSKYSI